MFPAATAPSSDQLEELSSDWFIPQRGTGSESGGRCKPTLNFDLKRTGRLMFCRSLYEINRILVKPAARRFNHHDAKLKLRSLNYSFIQMSCGGQITGNVTSVVVVFLH